jgi:hypothetical protein
MSEVQFYIVDSFHVDMLTPIPGGGLANILWLSHNGCYAVLTGDASFSIRVIHRDSKREWTKTISLKKGEFYKVVNIEGTPEYPGDWDTAISVVSGKPPRPAELFELKKAWLRQNVFLGEYALASGASALVGGVIGYLVKR